MSEIPEFVDDNLDQMNKEYDISIEELRKKYAKIFHTDWIQESNQFENDEDRYAYSIRRLWIDLDNMTEFDRTEEIEREIQQRIQRVKDLLKDANINYSSGHSIEMNLHSIEKKIGQLGEEIRKVKS